MEMKTRILSQLYGIAHKLPDSQAYYEQVLRKTGFPELTIRENAAEADDRRPKRDRFRRVFLNP